MLSPDRHDELRVFFRRLPLALVAAVAVWLAVRTAYNPALCWTAQALTRLYENPPASRVILDGDGALLGRSDLRADSGWLRISLTQITFNLVPLLALSFALPHPFRRGRWSRLLQALIILSGTHALTVVWHLKFLQATGMGAWSQANFSDLAREAYGMLQYFFDIPVTFALPLLLWVAAYPDDVFSLLGFDERR
jgi:hypothetical protein